MVKQEWLDEKVASRESFKILPRDQGVMGNDKIHIQVLTLVNQSDFNNCLLVLSMNPCGP